MSVSTYKEQGEVLKKGEQIYLGTLKQELIKKHIGEYVAVDVDSRDYVVDSNKLETIRKAQEKFGKKLFYIVQIGELDEPTINFRERENVAWIFA